MTSIVNLRQVQDEDLPVFFEHQADQAACHMVAFTQRDPLDRMAFLAHWEKIRQDTDVTIRTIVCDGQVAGNVAKFRHAGKTEVCYFLGREFWGKGIATAALSQLLLATEERPLYAGVAGDNVASIRVLAKCGFKIMGRKMSYAKSRGEEIEEVFLMLGA